MVVGEVKRHDNATLLAPIFSNNKSYNFRVQFHRVLATYGDQMHTQFITDI